MKINSSNYTKFGMHSNSERYSWAVYHIFILLSSLIGDTLILYASFQRDAFKLNEFIVTVIQYIAVSDLAYAISSALPGAISLLADNWILGDALCYGRVYLGFFIYTAAMLLIVVLTISKLLIVKYPMHRNKWTKKMAHRVCCFILMMPAQTFPILFLILDKNNIGFSHITYTCEYGFEKDIWKKLLPIITIITLFLPNVIIVAATIPTLKYLIEARKSARRVQGSVPWQGALTVALTAVIYCLSTLPIIFYYVSKPFVKDHTGQFLVHLYRVAKYLLLVNIMSNFYIYTLTVKSFRKFLVAKIICAKIVMRNPKSIGKNIMSMHNQLETVITIFSSDITSIFILFINAIRSMKQKLRFRAVFADEFFQKSSS